MFSLSTLYCTTVDWSLTTQIKQWERNVVFSWAGVCGEGWKTSSPKNACVGGYLNPKRTKTWRFEEKPRDLSSKMLWFVCCKQINYLAEANNKLICETLTNHDILRWPSSIIVLSFDHRVCLFNSYPWEAKQSDLPFSHRSDRKKEKSTVSFMYEQNIICSQTLLDGIAHEQTNICRQLFAGHLVGSRPMKRKKNLLRMIIIIIVF